MHLPFRSPKGVYQGPVVFADGAHYPVKNGAADRKHRLLWIAASAEYVYAKPTDPTHQGLYEQRQVEVTPE